MFSKNVSPRMTLIFRKNLIHWDIKKPKKNLFIQIIAAIPNDIEILHKIAINLLEQ